MWGNPKESSLLISSHRQERGHVPNPDLWRGIPVFPGFEGGLLQSPSVRGRCSGPEVAQHVTFCPKRVSFRQGVALFGLKSSGTFPFRCVTLVQLEVLQKRSKRLQQPTPSAETPPRTLGTPLPPNPAPPGAGKPASPGFSGRGSARGDGGAAQAGWTLQAAASFGAANF